MKFLVEFEESVTTKRKVKAFVEAEYDYEVEDQLHEGNYEVEDCYDCYDTDWELININSIEPCDEDLDD